MGAAFQLPFPKGLTKSIIIIHMECHNHCSQRYSAVFVTNTPMSEAEERKQCNPLIISSAEAHC